MKSSVNRSAIVACVWALLASVLCAHEGLEEAAKRLTARLEREGPRAELFMERGRIHRESGNWVAALRDFRSAEAIDRELYGVEVAFAELFADLRNWPVAREYATSHLTRYPEDAKGRQLLAKICFAEGRFSESAEHLTRVITSSSKPTPELYLARARALAEAGKPTDAIRGLDEGLLLLGQVPALQLKAIELERASSSTDAAIDRVNQLAKGAARKEHWLVLRGEIELEGERPEAARRSFQEAARAIDGLRPSQRTTRSVIELRVRLNDLDEQAKRLEGTISTGVPRANRAISKS